MPKKPTIDLTLLTKEQREKYEALLGAIEARMRRHREADPTDLEAQVTNQDIKAAKHELLMFERRMELDQAGKVESEEAHIKKLERENKALRALVVKYDPDALDKLEKDE